ncbi:hypothetical protein H5410_054067 [Solanum commersonii]|uniref:Uncharacterized protein n=1 Tax=Solanum commersonii TaxID=4109 RepID=A0A9J5X942_SOLCO|nr:hypothetical protein H5410_054067 [Solanum commersonii]
MPLYTLTTMDPLEETIELIKKHLAIKNYNIVHLMSRKRGDGQSHDWRKLKSIKLKVEFNIS